MNHDRIHSKRRPHALLVGFLVATGLLLSACGQKGPLVLPADQDAAPAASVASAPAGGKP